MDHPRFSIRSRFLLVILTTAIASYEVLPTCSAHNLRISPSRNHASSIQLTEFKATESNHGVLIQWRTTFEVDNLGFNVFRERKGLVEEINPGLIAGSALIVGPGYALDGGFSYSCFDPTGSIDCTYYLTSVEITGTVNSYPRFKPVIDTNPTSRHAELLTDLVPNPIAHTTQREWPDLIGSKSQSASVQTMTPSEVTDQWKIAAQPALKIGVRSNGLYRITQSEMAAAGFNTAANARNLRMFVNATEIAIRVSRESGALTGADFIEFWGEGLDTASADTQIYWLVNDTQAGKRISLVGDVQPDQGPSPVPVISRVQSPATNTGGLFAGITAARRVLESTAENPRRKQIGETPSTNDYSTNVDSSNRSSINGPAAVSAAASSALILPAAKTATESNSLIRKDSTAKRSRPSPATIASRKRRPLAASRPGYSRRPQTRRQVRSRRRSYLRSLRRRRHHASPISTVPVPAFLDTVERKDRTVYFSAALNGPQENFFGEVLINDPAPLLLILHNIEATSTLAAQLQVSLRGVTDQDHHIDVFVNSVLVGSLAFFGQDAETQTFSFPLSMLVEGDNEVKLTPAAPGNDVSVVDYVRLAYPHSFTADSDRLEFAVKSDQSPRLEGFASPNIRVLDISDATTVQELRPIIDSNGADFAATISPAARGKARRIVALTDDQISHPASLILNEPSTLNQDINEADLLIISYHDFIPALAPLVTQRHDRDGLTVKIVDIEDVYDEFSYGVHNAQSIKDLLSLALQKWTRPPRYLLLVGDASYDPRNYMGKGMWDFVPSMHVDTLLMEADSDDSLGDLDNDGIPELAIGRLPARSLSEASLMVSKIVNFTPANVPQSALMVADNPVGYDFEAFDEHLISLLPANMNVQRVYRSSDPAPHDNIVTKINLGVAMVNYSGHGNIDIWGGSIFSSSDALALNNGNRLPFVTVMDCLNGFFSDPVLDGLVESLLKAPNGGAIASFASSGLTIGITQHEMGERMFQLLYGPQSIAIGDVSRQAKSATQDIDVRRTWILFGDPSMRIR